MFTTKRKEWGKIVRDQEAKMRSRDSGCIESFTSRQRGSLYFNTFALHVQDKRCSHVKKFSGDSHHSYKDALFHMVVRSPIGFEFCI